MSGAEADKMPRPRAVSQLMTTVVTKQLSTGESQFLTQTREVSVKVNSYQSRKLGVGGRVNQTTARAWSLMNRAATKIFRGDLQEPVSSFYFGDGRGSTTRFNLLPRLSRCQVTAGHDGAYRQDYYRCPCSAFNNEGAGRSWAESDTSNLPGVERK